MFNTEIPRLRHHVGLGRAKMEGEHVRVFSRLMFMSLFASSQPQCCLAGCQVPAEWAQAGPVQGPGLAWQAAKEGLGAVHLTCSPTMEVC